MRNVYYIFVFVIILFSSTTVRSQFDNVGTSAATFLKIGVGSRGTSLGGAFTATVDDPSALYWNIAGLSHLQRNEIMFAHNDWIADVNHSFVGAGIPIEDFGTVGVSVTYLSMGDMKITTWEQTEGTGGTFTAYDLAIGLAYARNLTDQFSFGIQTKYVSEVISESQASALGVDVGVQYTTGISGIRLGASISNFGTTMRLQGRDTRLTIDPYPIAGSNPDDVVANTETQEWPMPMTFQFGIAMDAFKDNFNTFTVNMDYRDERDFRPVPYISAEYNFRGVLFLRGGTNLYVFEDRYSELEEQYKHISQLNATGVNAGVGVHWDFPEVNMLVKVDYSYSDLHILQSAHRITLGLAF
jgi:hypothetical protein